MIESKQKNPNHRWLSGVLLFAAASVLPLGRSLAQDSAGPPSRSVGVYAEEYEYDGRIFQTIDELTRALKQESGQVLVMECGADVRVVELLDRLKNRKQADIFIRGIDHRECE